MFVKHTAGFFARNAQLLSRRSMRLGNRAFSGINFSRTPVLSNASIRFPLETFPGSIVSSMPNISDLRSSSHDTLFHSLNEMLGRAFKKNPSLQEILSVGSGEEGVRLQAQNRRLEYVIDTAKMAPAGMIVHEVVYCEERGVIFYHPKIWAIRGMAAAATLGERSYSGLGLIPFMMAKFAFCLQLSYPDIPCYMAVPVYTPWVLRMLNKRFGLPYKRFEQPGWRLPAGEQALLDEAMRLLKLESIGENSHGYPLYKLRYDVNTEHFDTTHQSQNAEAIEDEVEFCKKFLVPAKEKSSHGQKENADNELDKLYDEKNQRFTTSGFLSIVPCSVPVFECFERSILASVGDYMRIFGRTLPPDNLFLDPDKKPSFLTDSANLYYFGKTHPRGVLPVEKPTPDITSFEGVKEQLKSCQHLYDFCGAPNKQVAKGSQKILSFHGKPISFSQPLVPTNITIKRDGNEKSVRSEVFRVNELTEDHGAFLLDQLIPLLKKSFKGGEFLLPEYFRLRLNRPHSYLEIFTDEQAKIVGFLFHEPFKLSLYTEEHPENPLEVVVLKSGLGCFDEGYQKHRMAPFFIRRFLLKLQLDHPGVPCYNHFISSSPSIFKAELEVCRNFPPLDDNFDLFLENFNPEPRERAGIKERKLSDEERELMRAIFCTEIRLKYETGGTALAGMFAYASSLPTGIPYPVVPKSNSSEHEFVNQLFVNATEEMESKAKKYGMKVSEQRDGEKVELLSPGIRVFSRLSPIRAAAYAHDKYDDIHLTTDNCYEPNKLMTAVGLWCSSGRAKDAFDLISKHGFSTEGIKQGMSFIVPDTQGKARDPNWPESLKVVEDDASNRFAASL